MLTLRTKFKFAQVFHVPNAVKEVVCEMKPAADRRTVTGYDYVITILIVHIMNGSDLALLTFPICLYNESV
jgi:hypothetical protein